MIILYRCSHYDDSEYWEVYRENIKIFFQTFEVIKETPCGFWVMDGRKYPQKKRFVKKDAMFTLAYTTKLKALRAYLQKKMKHIQYMKRNVEVMEIAIEKMKVVDGKATNDETLEKILNETPGGN